MRMLKYILKRLALLFVVSMIIMTICFVLIKLLPINYEAQTGTQAQMEYERREALGYFEPIPVQYGIYLKNIFTKWDWGTSWELERMTDVVDVISSRLFPTFLLNFYSIMFSIPFGILLGILAALKKNKWQDHFISTTVMLFISVPSYVYAFLVQFFLAHKLGWFPHIMASLYEAGAPTGTEAKYFFTWTMLHSMILPILALSFGTIASLARFTRAELTETLTSEYMLLARTKGLTRAQATIRHALKNAMVPILPTIVSLFLGLLSGSMIIEQIFAVRGIGRLYLNSIMTRDYDVFMACGMFYTVLGLGGMILVDLSYGFLDPRIRMGER